jgi:hypothetical protein
MVGVRCGHLLPIRKVRSEGRSDGARWLCLCDCGELAVHRGVKLRSGKARACPRCSKTRTARVDTAARTCIIPRADRGKRQRETRAVTLTARRVPKRDLWRMRAETASILAGEKLPPLPRTRNDCVDGPRPCTCVRCFYNLYADVDPETGALKLNFPDLEPDQMVESCALDVAERGGVVLEELGVFMNLTRERCRQLEMRALRKLARHPGLREMARDGE